MSIAEKLPPYIPPPWRQKNPIMEKACPAYYKNTAPAKAVEVLDSMKVKKDGSMLDKEIVFNGEGWAKEHPWKITVVVFKDEKWPDAVAMIYTKGGDFRHVEMAKYSWKAEITVTYKKEEIFRLPAKGFSIKRWKP